MNKQRRISLLKNSLYLLLILLVCVGVSEVVRQLPAVAAFNQDWVDANTRHNGWTGVLPYFDHMHRFIPALIKRLGGDVLVVQVNHRDRQHGTSNYTMMSRLWVGIIDMIGVLWLQKRTKIAHVVCEDE